MPNYRRYYVPGGTYFFTVNLLERDRRLLVDEISLLRNAVRRVRALYPFEINAWVVLPDHLHCVWTLPVGDTDFATRWRLIKLLFVKGLPKTERRSAVRTERAERGIWQRRYWEHCIRDNAEYRHHIDYVYLNPLKHGFVRQVREWPHSTFHRDVARGLYALNWAGGIPCVTDKAPAVIQRAQKPNRVEEGP